jgi:hypothetical protein
MKSRHSISLVATSAFAMATLISCQQQPKPTTLANLHVTCAGKTLDGNTEPPPNDAMACPAGTDMTFTYDNPGNFNYVIVFAVTHDDIFFYVPNDKDKTGQSVAVQPGAQNAPIGETFQMPNKARDIMAIFTREPLNSKEVDTKTREVTLGQIPGAEIRVRISTEIGPL